MTSQITKWALTKYTAGDGDFRLDRKEGMSCNKPFTLVWSKWNECSIFIQAHTEEAEEGDHGGEHCADTIPGKLLLQDLIALSLHAGLLDQPLVVEGKRRRKSTETFAIKHEAKRPVVKVATLCYSCTRGSQFCVALRKRLWLGSKRNQVINIPFKSWSGDQDEFWVTNIS